MMFKQNSLNLIKIPMAILAIGFVLFCLPKLVMGHGQSDNGAMMVTTKDIKISGLKTYRIWIAEPKALPPNEGWPLVVLLDGNTTFAMATALQPKAILVGIGYPTDKREDIVQRRYYDLASKAPLDKIPMRPGIKAPETGGEREFREFIINRILPELEAQYKLDAKHITLFGHSLGGLFVMNTLLSERSKVFQTYCAADPSIWWNGHEYMSRLEVYHKQDHFKPRIFIAVSGQKTNHKNIDEAQKKRLNDLRSGPNGEQVAQILSEKYALPNTFKRLDDKNHGTMIAPSIQDCLAFSL